MPTDLDLGGSFPSNGRAKRPRLNLRPVLQDFEDFINEELDNELEDFDDTDSDPDFVIESNNDTDSDQSDSEVREVDQSPIIGNVLVEAEQAEEIEADLVHIEEQCERDVQQKDLAEGINEQGNPQEEEQQHLAQTDDVPLATRIDDLSIPRRRREGTYYYGRRTKVMVKKNTNFQMEKRTTCTKC